MTEHIAIANRQESRVLLQGIIGNFKSITGTSLMATSFAIKSKSDSVCVGCVTCGQMARGNVPAINYACIVSGLHFPSIQHALDAYKSLLDHGASYVCICLETLITNISV